MKYDDNINDVYCLWWKMLKPGSESQKKIATDSSSTTSNSNRKKWFHKQLEGFTHWRKHDNKWESHLSVGQFTRWLACMAINLWCDVCTRDVYNVRCTPSNAHCSFHVVSFVSLHIKRNHKIESIVSWDTESYTNHNDIITSYQIYNTYNKIIRS